MKLYQKCPVIGPANYMEDLFREMMEQEIWLKSNPKQLALEFYAPFYLLVSISDAISDKQEAAQLLAAHIERFIEKNTVAPKDANQIGRSMNNGRKNNWHI